MTGDPVLPDGRATDWRRLSPRMLAVHPVMEVFRALPALIPVLFIGVSRAGDGSGQLWGLVGVGVVVCLGLLRWATTSYRVTPEQIQVRRGLLRRSVLTVRRDRVRSVDLTAHVMHRLLGLQRVVVGTGQSTRRGGDGLRLDALTTGEAARLREELLHQRRGVGAYAAPTAGRPPVDHPGPVAAGGVGTGLPAGPGAPAGPPTGPATGFPIRPATGLPGGPAGEEVLGRLRPAWLRYAPFSLSGLVTIFVVVGFGWRLVNDWQLRPDQNSAVRDAANQLRAASPTVLVASTAVGLVLLVAAFSTVGYLLAFWGFRLSRTGSGTLHVTRGLFTTRITTIEEARLRGVELVETLLLRAVRGARCQAITTGLRAGQGAERGGTPLCPPAPRAEAIRIGAAVLGDDRPLTVALTRHGPRATRRRFTRAVIPVAVLAGALYGLHLLDVVPLWPAQLATGLLPVAAGLAADRAANLGHALLPGILITRHGSLVGRRGTVSRAGIVGWTLRQSYFQRRAGLATLTATTAAGRQHYAVLDLPLPDAVQLADDALPQLLTPFLDPVPADPAGPADPRCP